MASAFIGEIKLFGGNFPIRDWLSCDGALHPISEYEALFTLIGTTYGGDGQSTFAVPDLRGRIPIHMGQGSGLSNRPIGQKAGAETVNLNVGNLPSHSHLLLVSSQQANTNAPGATSFAQTASPVLYSPPSGSIVNMAAETVGTSGQSQPADIMMPYLTLNFIICAFGIFPTPS